MSSLNSKSTCSYGSEMQTWRELELCLNRASRGNLFRWKRGLCLPRNESHRRVVRRAEVASTSFQGCTTAYYVILGARYQVTSMNFIPPPPSRPSHACVSFMLRWVILNHFVSSTPFLARALKSMEW